ncbi:2706_t:CDS:1, partial [Diversispora eburnea]
IIDSLVSVRIIPGTSASVSRDILSKLPISGISKATCFESK